MASHFAGSVVGTFKVGDGHVVGPPVFQPDKPQLKLNGKPFVTSVTVGDFKQVFVGKPRLTLRGKEFTVIVSSTALLTPATAPLLTLRGKAYRLVTPTTVFPGKAQIVLKGKHYNLVLSQTAVTGKPKLILKGQQINRVGRAGLIPNVPPTVILTPTAPVASDDLVPSPAYTGLLVPTAERFV